VGSVLLCHSVDAVVAQDVAAIRKLEAESAMFVLEHHQPFLSPLPSVVRARSTSGSADELRRRYEVMHETINSHAHRTGLARSRNPSTASAQGGAERGGGGARPLGEAVVSMLREATGYSLLGGGGGGGGGGGDRFAAEGGLAGDPHGGTLSRSRRSSRAGTLTRGGAEPARATYRPLSLATSAALVALGFGLGVAFGGARGRR
jgi:hypothetical protein